jgi:hypothetical protein
MSATIGLLEKFVTSFDACCTANGLKFNLNMEPLSLIGAVSLRSPLASLTLGAASRREGVTLRERRVPLPHPGRGLRRSKVLVTKKYSF